MQWEEVGAPELMAWHATDELNTTSSHQMARLWLLRCSLAQQLDLFCVLLLFCHPSLLSYHVMVSLCRG
jgi:hypothetical protein